MIEIEFDDAQFQKFMRNKPEAVAEHVDSALSRAALEVSRLVRKGAPKATSMLTNSIIPQRERSLEHWVIAGAGYARDVEYGKRPGSPVSPASILSWMKTKGITPRHGSMKSSSFLIARSIRHRGVAAQPFFRPALKIMRPRIKSLIEAGVKKGLAS